MSVLPPAADLSIAGMAFVAAFALWKLQVQPRLRRARSPAANV